MRTGRFWNVSLKGNNGRIKVKVVDDLVITQIALSSHKPKEGRTTLLLHLSGADDSEQTVCIGSLASPRCEQLSCELILNEDTYYLEALGPNTVDVTGYYYLDDGSEATNTDTDSSQTEDQGAEPQSNAIPLRKGKGKEKE